MGHAVFTGRPGKGKLVVMIHPVLGFFRTRLLQRRTQGGEKDIPFTR